MKSVCSSAGSLPSVEDGVVDREACTDVNCHPVYDIQIINCPDISYVYYLVPTISCDDAYCMGTLHVIIALNFSNKIAIKKYVHVQREQFSFFVSIFATYRLLHSVPF